MIALSLWTHTAAAHRPGLSVAKLEGDTLSLEFSAADWHQLDATLPGLSVTVDEAPCALGSPVLEVVSDGGTHVTVPLDCPPGEVWSYQTDALATLSTGHRQYVEADGQALAVLTPGAPGTTFNTAEASAGETALEFLHLGVEHILIGADHLVFLLALLLVVRNAKETLQIVTGFTIGHSVTLSMAALGWVVPSTRIIEIAIAASIVYAGLENLTRPSPRKRLPLVIGLGLIHGFGFANVLRDLGLPDANLLLALFAFNGGVELGQLMLVALALPLLWTAARWASWERRAVPALSLGIAMLGIYWTIERAIQ
jgi:hydrogenase/urease accessory protein HupE